MSELKPCPFCGGSAKIFHNTESGTDKVLIECQKCFAETYYYQLEISAVEHWNKREKQHCTQCEALKAEVERLKGELKKILSEFDNAVSTENRYCYGELLTQLRELIEVTK